MIRVTRESGGSEWGTNEKDKKQWHKPDIYLWSLSLFWLKLRFNLFRIGDVSNNDEIEIQSISPCRITNQNGVRTSHSTCLAHTHCLVRSFVRLFVSRKERSFGRGRITPERRQMQGEKGHSSEGVFLCIDRYFQGRRKVVNRKMPEYKQEIVFSLYTSVQWSGVRENPTREKNTITSKTIHGIHRTRNKRCGKCMA